MITIRKCSIGDFDEVCRLLQQLWPEKELDTASLRKTFRKALDTSYQYYFCALKDKAIVGFCSLSVRNSLWQAGPLAHIDEMIVDAGCRSEGIGTRLLREAQAIAERAGCACLELDTAFHREDAHRFYEKNGLQRRGLAFSKRIDV